MKANSDPPKISKTGPLTSADLVRVAEAAERRWPATALRRRMVEKRKAFLREILPDEVDEYPHHVLVWYARYRLRSVVLFAFWRRAK